MANAPLGAFVYDTNLPYAQMRPAVAHSTSASQAGNVLVANSFVKLSSNLLAANAAGDTTTYGFTLDASHISTDEPYTAPNGVTNSPVDVLNTKFVVNASSVSATSMSTPTLGSVYGLGVTAAGVPFIDLPNTTATFFRVEARYPDDAATDINCRYICTVTATRQ